jgi:hypothetical protein
MQRHIFEEVLISLLGLEGDRNKVVCHQQACEIMDNWMDNRMENKQYLYDFIIFISDI